MTLIENAKRGIPTAEMKQAAMNENIPLETVMKNIADGTMVVVKSVAHDCSAVGIGKGCRIKINANIGTSNINSSIDSEMEKLKAAVKYGSDTIMDLSTGGNISLIRKKILEETRVPVGTVPIYQAIVKNPDVKTLTGDDMIESIRSHVEDGVDFITVHCGITMDCIPMLKNRIMGVVSRGGSFLIKWMLEHNTENPLYTRYDEIIEIAKKYDVTLSLGDGLRPGCLADASDSAQYQELKNLGRLAKLALDAGVQVMIEGPGHVPLHLIKENIEMQKKYCNGAPFYVLGPLVTDVSPGYDHISGAIGGALAASYGADFLCYLTPKEHLGLPDIEHVIDGVVASKIAAHAADIARGIPGARDVDDEMSRARSNLDWEKMFGLAMNPEKARSMRDIRMKENENVCSMCGDLCSARINKECRQKY